MTRAQLIAVLVTIQDEPSNEGQDIVSFAQSLGAHINLLDYVLGHFARLPDRDAKVRVLEITRMIAAQEMLQV